MSACAVHIQYLCSIRGGQATAHYSTKSMELLMAVRFNLVLDPSCVECFHIPIPLLLFLPHLSCGIMSGQHYLKGH